MSTASAPLTTGGVLTGITTMFTAMTLVIDKYAEHIKAGVDKLKGSSNAVIRTIGKVIGAVLSLFAAVGASEEAKTILNLPSEGASKVKNAAKKRRKKTKKAKKPQGDQAQNVQDAKEVTSKRRTKAEKTDKK
jgi:hypothetical protein